MADRSPAALLVPLPRSIELRTGAFALDRPIVMDASSGWRSPALGRLREELERKGCRLDSGENAGAIELVLDERCGRAREGYGLEIDERRVRVVAATAAGLAHGARTLAQLVRASERALLALAIEDAPVFERRGVMLDVSRDRVPRMDFLFRLVEQLAEWKLNELQLYFEHAFAYAGHERVWRGVDPFTHDEIRALDRHCAEHGIELVPNQQSFGHLHHWLKHAEYRHLAEVPEGIVHPFLGAGETHPEPFSLCPTDPRSLEFLAGLYDQLLPCFSSGDFNVGLDETIDLGPGRSAAAIRERGAGRAYLDFLRQVHGLVSARGKRMQFWADILLHHAELVPEVPKDAVAMLWGYEADHPFEEQTRTLAEAGLPFYVCPGTSSWQSIGGRIDNMLENVRSGARWGAAHGALGLLITDWGDRGHLQPPIVSLPGFLAAADMAWNPGAAERYERDFDELLQLHLSPLRLLGLSAAVLALGRAARGCEVRVPNASPLSVLLTKFDLPFPPTELRELHPFRVSRVDEALEHALDRLSQGLRFLADKDALPGSEEAFQEMRRLGHETLWAGELMRFACALALARIQAGDGRPVQALAVPERQELAERLAPLISRHRELWLQRSRHGGLERSCAWLKRVLRALRGG